MPLVISPFHDVTLSKYADDVKIYVAYNKDNFSVNSSQLQNSLIALHQYTIDNQLSLSPSKSLHIHFGSPRLIASYSMDNVPILRTSQVRDLGLLISSSLNRGVTVADRVSKARAAMFSLFKAVSSTDYRILTRCFKAYVIPHLEYASQVWNPFTAKDIDSLERVQRTFTRLVFYRAFPSPTYPQSLPSYSDRLKKLDMCTLHERRTMADFSLARKIMRGETVLKRSNFFKYRPVPPRRPSIGIRIPFARNPLRYNSFSLRVSRLLNKLPISILGLRTRDAIMKVLSQHS